MSDHASIQGNFYIKRKLYEVLLSEERLFLTAVSKSRSKDASKSKKSDLQDEDVQSKETISTGDQNHLIQGQKEQRHLQAGTKTYIIASNILGVDLIYKKINKDDSGNVIGFTMITCVKKGHKFSIQNIKLLSDNESLCTQWFNRIQTIIRGKKNRPKRVFVIVNPHSGKGRADKVYRKKIEPLFQACGLKIDILKTMYPRHAWEHTRTMTLTSYDCIVCVGGDGIVHEAINGLVEKAQVDCGINLKQLPEDFKPVKVNIPIGIIPAGSTDVIVYSAQGINDPITSACHIILGNHQSLDLCSLQRDKQLQRFAFSSAYGYLGDVLEFSEKSRWMGPKRYKWAAFKALCNLRDVEVEVSFISSPNNNSHPRDNTRCRKGCNICSSDSVVTDASTGKCTLRCQAVGVSLITLPSPCDISPEGPSPSCHLADGCTDLIIVKKCSKPQMYRFIHRNTGYGDQFDLDFVETYRVKDCDIKHCGSEALGFWNVDGELVKEQALSIRVHRQLITVYGEGIDEVETSAGCIS